MLQQVISNTFFFFFYIFILINFLFKQDLPFIEHMYDASDSLRIATHYIFYYSVILYLNY